MDNLCLDKNPGVKIDGKLKGLTPMHAAAKHGHLKVVQMIKTQTGVKNPVDAKVPKYQS